MSEVVIVTNAQQRITGHKGNSCEHRGADIDMDSSPVWQVIVVDRKIARKGRPEVCAQQQNAMGNTGE